MNGPATHSFFKKFDGWLFAGGHPLTCSLMRVVYASVLLIYLWMLGRELEYWFTDAGVLSSQTAQATLKGDYRSLLFLLPSDLTTVTICWWLMFVQAILLLLGVLSRFQMACLFVWLVSFQHRNMLIFDGQDTLLRMLTFTMIFMPLDYAWSLSGWLRGRFLAPHAKKTPCRPACGEYAGEASGKVEAFPSAWALRLIQIQLTFIYFSTAWEKLQGETWRDGTALFYVSRMEDLYGRMPLPEFLFQSPWLLAGMTWGVLALESLIPLALWWRPTRRWAVLAAIGLHLSIELTMHIFLFEWLMIVGLLSFVTFPRAETAEGCQY